MTRAFHALRTAALIVWWSPTIGLAALQAAPVLAPAVRDLLRMAGVRYRLRRAARLIARGKRAEAERTLAATRRDVEAMAMCLARIAP